MRGNNKEIPVLCEYCLAVSCRVILKCCFINSRINHRITQTQRRRPVRVPAREHRVCAWCWMLVLMLRASFCLTLTRAPGYLHIRGLGSAASGHLRGSWLGWSRIGPAGGSPVPAPQTRPSRASRRPDGRRTHNDAKCVMMSFSGLMRALGCFHTP